ncbi:restriction endonuclease subunit S [Pseudoscardovia suis]|uniref:restriction endonuclease subunit S n=1 Tax=Pseudoscardovia suis TaxID=987063 RepID=UPI003F95D6B1
MLSDECIEDEVPFEIPDSWEWARLGSIVNIVSARRIHQSDWKSEGIPFYRAREIVKLAHGEPIRNPLYISETLYNRLKQDGLPQSGDLMVTGVGTIGTTYIVKSDDVFYYKDASVLCFENRSDLSSEYLRLLMQTQFMLNQIRHASSGTTVATITMKNAVNFFVPIPPLAEQRRIVARVAELLPLVEEYGRLEDAREELDSSLPDRLRKSVLQEAVEGRLVPQDPADEPASVLLDRIREERHRLIEEGKLKFPKGGESIIYRASDGARYEKRIDAKGRVLSDECIEDEIPFEIPDSWEWARFSQIIPIQYGFPADSQLFSPHGKIGLVRIRDVNSGDLIHTSIRYNGDFDESYLVKRGDDLIGMDGEFHCHRWKGSDSLLNQRVCRLDYIPGTLSQNFVAYIVDWYLSEIWKTTSKTTVKHLSAKALDELLFAVPPLSEQHRIVAKVNEISELLTNQ